MGIPVIPSTFFLTLLLAIGLLFFIRAAVKDRTEVAKFISHQSNEELFSLIKNYFDIKNVKLGQTVDINTLTTQILSIDGVTSVNTVRIVNNQEIKRIGLSFLAFNPIYSNPKEDIQIINQTYSLPYFKIPYLFNGDTLLNQIKIVTPDFQESSLREF